MGQGPARGIEEDEPFTIDGVEFVPTWARRSQPRSFALQKSARMVDAYRRLVARHPHPRMVELGIFQGGSVAMLTLLGQPSRFVAVEYSDQPIEALATFIADSGLVDVVRPYYGVDQADRGRLEAIVGSDLGGEPIDLVIDDASHRYPETVASFEVLFPRLAPGGVYVIEDWTCDDTTAAAMARAMADASSEVGAKLRAAFDESKDDFSPDAVARVQPLSRLAVELVMAQRCLVTPSARCAWTRTGSRWSAAPSRSIPARSGCGTSFPTTSDGCRRCRQICWRIAPHPQRRTPRRCGGAMANSR